MTYICKKCLLTVAMSSDEADPQTRACGHVCGQGSSALDEISLSSGKRREVAVPRTAPIVSAGDRGFSGAGWCCWK
jgi:hypothetical protein